MFVFRTVHSKQSDQDMLDLLDRLLRDDEAQRNCSGGKCSASCRETVKKAPEKQQELIIKYGCFAINADTFVRSLPACDAVQLKQVIERVYNV